MPYKEEKVAIIKPTREKKERTILLFILPLLLLLLIQVHSTDHHSAGQDK